MKKENGILISVEESDIEFLKKDPEKFWEDITCIRKGAFLFIYNLTSIELPGSIKSIGEGSFFGCSHLTNITIPESVNDIGDDAFFDCKRLKYIHILKNNGIIISEEQIANENIVSVIDTTKYFKAINDFDMKWLLQKGKKVNLNTLNTLCKNLVKENIQVDSSFVRGLIENNLLDCFIKQPYFKSILKLIKSRNIDSNSDKTKAYINKLKKEVFAEKKKNNIDVQ